MALILDGNNIAYRIWSTEAGNLSTRKGERVGVCYGFIKMLHSFLNSEEFDRYPSYKRPVIVVWDIGKSKRRRELYPEYKGNREKDDSFNDFIEQVNLIKEVIPHFPIISLQLKGYEGDDLIAAICYYLQEEQNVIVTADKDLTTLIDDNVSMFKLDMFTAGHTLITKANFSEKLKIKYKKKGEPAETPIPFNKMMDLKVLEGDTSDNINGVAGVGKVSIAQLFETFGGLQEALAVEDYVGDTKLMKTLEKIRASEDIIKRNYELIDLKKFLDAEILTYVGEELLKDKVVNVEGIRAFYKEKEFSSLMLSLNDLLSYLI